MNALFIFLIVYLAYGCLIAICAEDMGDIFIKKHPNLSTFAIVTLWGPAFTFSLLYAVSTGSMRRNEADRVSEFEKQDKED